MFDDLLSILFFLLIGGIPVLLTVFNVLPLFRKVRKTTVAVTEFFGIVIGAVYLLIALSLLNISQNMWYEEIYEIYRYPPYDLSRLYQLLLISFLGLLGWAFLRLCPPEKQPPLAAVLSFGALYAVLTESVLLMIQLWGCENWWFILVYPLDLLLILVKLIREQVLYRKQQPVREELRGLQKILSYSGSLPVLGFVFLAIFVGLLVLVLILFGQTPDELIRVWTNTAEWNLSLQTPPPKVPYDGHYLCTVAANGHPKLVRPLRTGKRGGHPILVNRQLMIANAFEDLIRERTPRFHRAVRTFYDKTGFPISRYITTKWRSDAVYLLMKPLEWGVLLVLYLFDPRPEDRIAVQYPDECQSK